MSSPQPRADPLQTTYQLRQELQDDLNKLLGAVEHANRTIERTRSAITQICLAEDHLYSKAS